MDTLPEHVSVNQAMWNEAAPEWGIWGVPETDLALLPNDMTGMETIELGCGTGYVSGWMARRGASCVGIDISENQLATARRLAGEHGVELTLIHGSAESVPYPDASFDFAISEYGAALWCDPGVWVPEAARLLRPGGDLAFLTNHPLAVVCSPLDGSLPLTEKLERDYFSIGRLDWSDAIDDPGGIEFNRPISSWFQLLTASGFEVTGFNEIRSPEGGDEIRFFATADWAQKWPTEMAFKARRR